MQEMARGLARKVKRAGKKRHKGRQEKAQGQPRKGARHKGRQEKAQGQARKGTRASKKSHKDKDTHGPRTAKNLTFFVIPG